MGQVFRFVSRLFKPRNGFWGGYMAAYVRLPWQDAWVVAFERLKPGCQGYHWILFPKSHFNFFKNNHARIQAKEGEPAQPVRA